MTDFAYRNGVLHAENVSLAAAAQSLGTPFYCYSFAGLTRNYEAFAKAFADMPVTICYAVKANGNPAVIRSFAVLGAGADVVSSGEMRLALHAGVPADRIVFSGVGKTREEIAEAIQHAIMQINVESRAELNAIADIAAASGRTIDVSLRVNPDVDADTHAKITTGKSENKFGVDFAEARELYAEAMRLPGIRPSGVAVHIGSQLTGLGPFRAAFGRIAELVGTLRADGMPVGRIDLGGGLGIGYRDEAPPTPAEYAAVVREILRPLDCALVIEPGRALVGAAGVLISRVLYVKSGATRDFVILDAGMNDLLRPALYDAYHEILPLEDPQGAPTRPVDVVGPICETGDTFARGRELPELAPGNGVAIMAAGAYGAAMASNYNARPLPAEIMVNGGAYAIIRPRQSVEELIAASRMPGWLADRVTPRNRRSK